MTVVAAFFAKFPRLPHRARRQVIKDVVKDPKVLEALASQAEEALAL